MYQTRTLATFIAATVPIEKGKDNPLMDAASAIGEPRDDKTEQNAPAQKENQPGSFESLMRMLMPR